MHHCVSSSHLQRAFLQKYYHPMHLASLLIFALHSYPHHLKLVGNCYANFHKTPSLYNSLLCRPSRQLNQHHRREFCQLLCLANRRQASYLHRYPSFRRNHPTYRKNVYSHCLMYERWVQYYCCYLIGPCNLPMYLPTNQCTLYVSKGKRHFHKCSEQSFVLLKCLAFPN